MLEMPIYRAKEKYRDNFIEGFYTEINKRSYIVNSIDKSTEIDKETLAIHFPNMKSEKNQKIFASLNENGKGGDLITFFEDKDYSKKAVFIFDTSLETVPTVELLGLASSKDEETEYFSICKTLDKFKIEKIYI